MTETVKRIREEISYCFTYEKGKTETCIGASGRKLRSTCCWCPNYKKPGGEGHENRELSVG